MRTKKKKNSDCGFCGGDTAGFGTATCPKCSETKCVETCIPGGNNTVCVECEEAGDGDDEE